MTSCTTCGETTPNKSCMDCYDEEPMKIKRNMDLARLSEYVECDDASLTMVRDELVRRFDGKKIKKIDARAFFDAVLDALRMVSR